MNYDKFLAGNSRRTALPENSRGKYYRIAMFFNE